MEVWGCQWPSWLRLKAGLAERWRWERDDIFRTPGSGCALGRAHLFEFPLALKNTQTNTPCVHGHLCVAKGKAHESLLVLGESCLFRVFFRAPWRKDQRCSNPPVSSSLLNYLSQHHAPSSPLSFSSIFSHVLLYVCLKILFPEKEIFPGSSYPFGFHPLSPTSHHQTAWKRKTHEPLHFLILYHQLTPCK